MTEDQISAVMVLADRYADALPREMWGNRKALESALRAMPEAAPAQRIKEAHEQIVSLRAELRVYREREKTMGWSQS